MVLLLPSVTAPLRANALPSRVALSFSVIVVKATMLPFMTLPVPMVAELPTCHQTFFAWAPPMRLTEPATGRALGTCMTNVALVLPRPSGGRGPVGLTDEGGK